MNQPPLSPREISRRVGLLSPEELNYIVKAKNARPNVKAIARNRLRRIVAGINAYIHKETIRNMERKKVRNVIHRRQKTAKARTRPTGLSVRASTTKRVPMTRSYQAHIQYLINRYGN